MSSNNQPWKKSSLKNKSRFYNPSSTEKTLASRNFDSGYEEDMQKLKRLDEKVGKMKNEMNILHQNKVIKEISHSSLHILIDNQSYHVF
jgi:hypothetical protein